MRGLTAVLLAMLVVCTVFCSAIATEEGSLGEGPVNGNQAPPAGAATAAEDGSINANPDNNGNQAEATTMAATGTTALEPATSQVEAVAPGLPTLVDDAQLVNLAPAEQQHGGEGVRVAGVLSDLGKLGDKAKNTVKGLADSAAAAVNAAVDDIKAIYADAATCLAAVDRVRIRVMKRVLEYHTAATRAVLDAGLLPTDLMTEVFKKVAPKLVRDPKPQLWKLHNPTAAVWNRQAADLRRANTTFLDVSVKSYFYVHGAFYDGSKESSFADWLSIARSTRLFDKTFSPWACTDTTCNVYLLAYDTRWEAAFEALVRDAIATVLGVPVTGSSLFLYQAAVWREYERRARVAGDYLASILAPLPARYKGTWLQNIMISQSLGSYVVAYAANKMYTARPRDDGCFVQWANLAGALPNNAYSATGLFPKAPYLTKGERGLTVFYSMIDDTLSTLYFLATGTVAMGQVGSTVDPPDTLFTNVDTMPNTGNTHAPIFDYYKKVAPLLQSRIF